MPSSSFWQYENIYVISLALVAVQKIINRQFTFFAYFKKIFFLLFFFCWTRGQENILMPARGHLPTHFVQLLPPWKKTSYQINNINKSIRSKFALKNSLNRVAAHFIRPHKMRSAAIKPNSRDGYHCKCLAPNFCLGRRGRYNIWGIYLASWWRHIKSKAKVCVEIFSDMGRLAFFITV